MISVVVYGRNDSHGYNLHKRAAISLNCIAELLTDPDDEILFTDCNTPDDLPTFPESIQDTLTPRAKARLRVIRLRAALFARHRRGSHLPALEPLSRNVAVRRSNPANRWILSTNTDMVFVPAEPGRSLSALVAALPDGFYELPRFEVPESLWESVDRLAPTSVMAAFDAWGRRLHLNEVITSEPFIRYDGPGDFQLVLREQLWAIDGFDEAMVLGWHVDSNLCKRLHLLNGSTESLLDQLRAYHCDHTRQATTVHRHDRTENDQERFVRRVTTPFLPGQRDGWGLPEVPLEELRLDGVHLERYARELEALLPGLAAPMTEDVMTLQTYNHGLLYDTAHVMPYLADHVVTLAPEASLGYGGGNVELLRLLAAFRARCGHAGPIWCDAGLLAQATRNAPPDLPPGCTAVTTAEMVERAGLFVLDAAFMGFPSEVNPAGVRVPAPTLATARYARSLFDTLVAAARGEHQRRQDGAAVSRKFLLVGSQHTWLEVAAAELIAVVPTVFSTRVRHGYLRADAFTRPLSPPALHTLLLGASPAEWRRALGRELARPVAAEEHQAAEAAVSRLVRATGTPDRFVEVARELEVTDVTLALMRLHAAGAELDGREEQAELFRILASIVARLHPDVALPATAGSAELAGMGAAR